MNFLTKQFYHGVLFVSLSILFLMSGFLSRPVVEKHFGDTLRTHLHLTVEKPTDLDISVDPSVDTVLVVFDETTGHLEMLRIPDGLSRALGSGATHIAIIDVLDTGPDCFLSFEMLMGESFVTVRLFGVKDATVKVRPVEEKEKAKSEGF